MILILSLPLLFSSFFTLDWIAAYPFSGKEKIQILLLLGDSSAKRWLK